MGALETLYAEAGDGAQIAYQVLGEGATDLLYLTGATSHVDLRWELPPFARFQHRLASFARLILFDRRGSGASDAVALDALPTWEEWADDQRVVLDAVRSDRAAVFATLDAGPMALIFAATNPDRVSALILGNSSARVLRAPDYPFGLSEDVAERFLAHMRARWGTEEYAQYAAPSVAGDDQLKAAIARYLRACATPRAAAAHFRAFLGIDAREVLASIQAPTLVLHREQFGLLSADHARYLADHIPGARLSMLEGSDTAFGFGRPDDALEVVQEFLTGLRPPSHSDRVLATVLFTDLVDSTGRAASLGDSRWREILDAHDAVTRREIEEHGGQVVKTTGDGVLAVFTAPGKAIRSTLALRREVERLGLQLRAGLHAGEIEVRRDDISGIAVHISQRICGLAAGGEILVSSTVNDLVIGSGLEFREFGDHELRGIPGSWRVFSVA